VAVGSGVLGVEDADEVQARFRHTKKWLPNKLAGS
jgi:hypothetical protein